MKITYCLLLYLHRFIWNTLDDSTSCLRSHITVHLQLFVYAFQACTSSLLAFFQCTCRLFIRIKFFKEPCLTIYLCSYQPSWKLLFCSNFYMTEKPIFFFFLSVFIVKITVTCTIKETGTRNSFLSNFLRCILCKQDYYVVSNLLLNFLFI